VRRENTGPVEEDPGDEGVVFRTCRQPHANGGEQKPFYVFISFVPPAKIAQDAGRREKDHPEIDVGRDGQAHHHRVLTNTSRPSIPTPFPPDSSGMRKPDIRAQSEEHVDQRRHEIAAEQQWNDVQQVDVHREITERGPGRLEEATVTDPELWNGEMVDERIAGNQAASGTEAPRR